MTVHFRIGILGDAHGNAAGLNICITYLLNQGVHTFIHLGDAVGYMPYGNEVCNMLLRNNAISIMGNHEAMLIDLQPIAPEKDAIYGLKRLRSTLPSNWLRAVEANGPMLHLNVGGRRLLLCHGTPQDPLSGYGHNPGAIHVPDGIDCILTAHTHRPHLTIHDGTLLLNPGSCGMPRDSGKLLSFAILELPEMKAKIIRLPFTPSPKLLQAVHPLVRKCFDRNESHVIATAKEFCS